MTSSPTVSVITITLNDLSGLKRTVESVRGQCYPGRIEHIVIDGGSGADVVDYLSRYEPALAYWQSTPDAGRYDAMNQGIAHASGDLLWFLHSADCYSDASAVNDVVRILSRHGQVDQLWGYGIEHEIAPDGTSAGFQAPIPFDLRKFLTLRGTIPHQAAFFGASLVKRLGAYDVEFPIAADQLFMLRAALVVEPITVARVVANFDTGGAGSVRAVSECFQDMRRMWDRVDRYPFNGRLASLVYLRCWEYLVQIKLAGSRAVTTLKTQAALRSDHGTAVMTELR
ncbi:glycosyltransferase [Mycobacterium sp. 21AC1]|uniref:glycosyltransferase family 2 protein n=1 Tax=[Mycobacterium] appelbergii TaxID=2939269 RepID=UPI0029393739|nr:glycosyltransferase family 2 protein [Mycobacterium sp. 21AC1]MDV3128663.1 glycosyltransferase [Mycobacterium sp. 21AC1]